MSPKNHNDAPASAQGLAEPRNRHPERSEGSALTFLGSGLAAACLVGAAFVFSSAASAQQASTSAASKPRAYDLTREVSLQGTVVSFQANSATAPGAHVSVQTSTGVVDINLGNPRLLTSNNFTLAAGDSIRVVGENVTLRGQSQFLARIIQKGTQAVALRTPLGSPYRPKPSAASANAQKGGAL